MCSLLTGLAGNETITVRWHYRFRTGGQLYKVNRLALTASATLTNDRVSNEGANMTGSLVPTLRCEPSPSYASSLSHLFSPPLPPSQPQVASWGLQFGGLRCTVRSLEIARWLPRHHSHLGSDHGCTVRYTRSHAYSKCSTHVFHFHR